MSRADRLVALLEERALDCLLVTDLVNVRYLTGFTGTNGACLVSPEERTFFTDFRYVERAGSEVQGFDRVEAGREMLGDLARRLHGRAGFDDAHMSVRTHRQLGEKVEGGVELVPAGGLVERLRAVKEAGELERIRAATALADDVLRGVLEHGLAGRTEREVAFEIETEIRRRGAEPSFPSIVAAGPNGALPHAQPGDVAIAHDTLVVIDMGAVLDGYCSDCTRTLATGPLPDAAAEVYELVRSTQEASLELVRPGAECRAVDAFARERIEAAGHGERFGHGLGHGVGLEVHEGPTLSRLGEGELATGNVVTVEPGIDLPNELGVRIEDLVVVDETGCDVLSGFPKELTTVG